MLKNFEEIGMPIVIAFGGKGRGMIVFIKNSEISKFFPQLKTEANSLRDDTMYAEKFLTNANTLNFK